MAGPTVLHLSDVRKTYGGRDVLTGLNFELSAGECVALLGPNGAGKSTTIALALGLAQADSGTVHLLGKALPNDGHLARQHVGVVPQYDALDPDFTVFENLMVFGRYFGLHGDKLRERAELLLSFAQLLNRRNDSVATLSGGMRRRLMLARALINTPKVLFLDEPTTGLDPQAKHVIWDRLVELKREGMAMFLTTHYMDEAQRLADRVAVLDHGNIVACDKPLSLIRNVVGHAVLELWGLGAANWVAQFANLQRGGPRSGPMDRSTDRPMDGLIGELNGKSSTEPRTEPISMSPTEPVEQRGETFYFRNDKADQVLEVLKRSPQSDVDYIYRPGNLEDVFFTLTGRALRDD